MNLLLESPASVPYFTAVAGTLRDLGIDARDFDWFLSDAETNRHDDHDALTGWWTGEEMTALLAPAGLQFIWGVFSAFTPGTRMDVTDPPCADGNASYWRGGQSLRPALPGALFELVCWDSEATLLIGLDERQAQHYVNAHPDARPLMPSSTF